MLGNYRVSKTTRDLYSSAQLHGVSQLIPEEISGLAEGP
jgi:hypothetical protein